MLQITIMLYLKNKIKKNKLLIKKIYTVVQYGVHGKCGGRVMT